MKFDLNSKWQVETDGLGVAVMKKGIGQKGKSKGKQIITDRYYYPDLEKALDGLINRDIQELDKLTEVVNRISELKKDVRKMLQDLRNKAATDTHKRLLPKKDL